MSRRLIGSAIYSLFITVVAGCILRANAPAALDLAHIPLAFEQNRGQAAKSTRFLANAGAYQIELRPGNAVLRSRASAPITVQFAGANPAARIEGVDLLSSKTNYLTDPNPAKWKRNIPNFARVRYGGIYRSIDVIFYGDRSHVEYDFVLTPGADPNAIRLRFTGARPELDGSGDIVLNAGANEFRQRKPVVYQERNGARVLVTGEYALDHGDVIFRTATYDATARLVIDPVISYVGTISNASSDGTPLGAVAVDGSGNVYAVGWPNLVQKLTISPAGAASIVYSTYFGNAVNGGQDSMGISGIAVDGSGQAYLSGGVNDYIAHGSALAIINGFSTLCYSCGFLGKLSSDGSTVLYSTYTGHISGGYRTAVAVQTNGVAVVVGSTDDAAFPTKNAAQPTFGGQADAVVTKVDTTQAGSASLVYSTFLGGSLTEFANAVAVDSAGNAYVTGATGSSNFPTRNPLQTFATYQGPNPAGYQGGDAFVTKFDPNGNLLYSTFLGGSGDDEGNGIAVDGNSNIYVAGSTQSADFPVHNGYQLHYAGNGNRPYEQFLFGNAFLAKISSDGQSLLYSTYLGGSDGDAATALALDAAGGAYVAGITSSGDFPTLNPLHGVGMVKSADGGSTWSIPGSGLPFSVQAIATDPQRPADWFSATEQGVFTSTDSGAHWAASSVTSSANAIAVDATVNPTIVYAATVAGVYVSSDGGSSWAAANSGWTSQYPVNIMTVPGRTPSVWVYTSGGLYKSTDHGSTWTLVFSNTQTYPATPPRPLPRAPLAYDPNAPNTVYAWDSLSGISKTTDGGSTWAVTGVDSFDNWVQAFAVSGASVLYVSTVDYGLFTSSDGGNTWSSCGMGNDVQRIAFGPNSASTVYAAGLQGVFKSTDSCSTFSSVLQASTMDISWDAAGANLFAGTYVSSPSPTPEAAFLAKFDTTQAGSSSLIYSSYYGALGGAAASSIATDAAGNAFVLGTISSALTNADGSITSRTSGLNYDTLLLKVGGVVLTSPTNPTAESGAVTVNFGSVTTSGTTTVSSIDPATAGQTPGGFAISNIEAFEISTTASVSGPIVSCFVVNGVDPTTLANLRVLHSESVNGSYQLVDRTYSSNPATQTICAQTSSLSPFFMERVGQKLAPLFDQTKAYNSGSTLPIKVQLRDDSGANISSAAIPLTVRSIKMIGQPTLATSATSGTGTPDTTFRYDSTIPGYIYNLSLKNYAPGRYSMSVFVGSDLKFFYNVEFQVR